MNTRQITWFLLVLLVINLTALGTMLFLYLNTQTPARINCEKNLKHQRLEQLLEFNESQRQSFRELRQHHKSNCVFLHREIGEKRQSLFLEITSSQPDTIKIKQLNHDLGLLHEQMQNFLSLHLISVRKLCSGGQTERFDSTIAGIIVNHCEPGIITSKNKHKYFQNKCQTNKKQNEN